MASKIISALMVIAGVMVIGAIADRGDKDERTCRDDVRDRQGYRVS